MQTFTMSGNVRLGDYIHKIPASLYGCREIGFSTLRSWLYSPKFHNYLMSCMTPMQRERVMRLEELACGRPDSSWNPATFAISNLLIHQWSLETVVEVTFPHNFSDTALAWVGWNLAPYFPQTSFEMVRLPARKITGMESSGLRWRGIGGDPYGAFWWGALMLRVVMEAAVELSTVDDYFTMALNSPPRSALAKAFGTNPQSDLERTIESWAKLKTGEMPASIFLLMLGCGPNTMSRMSSEPRPYSGLSAWEHNIMTYAAPTSAYAVPSPSPWKEV